MQDNIINSYSRQCNKFIHKTMNSYIANLCIKINIYRYIHPFTLLHTQFLNFHICSILIFLFKSFFLYSFSHKPSALFITRILKSLKVLGHKNLMVPWLKFLAELIFQKECCLSNSERVSLIFGWKLWIKLIRKQWNCFVLPLQKMNKYHCYFYDFYKNNSMIFWRLFIQTIFSKESFHLWL